MLGRPIPLASISLTNDASVYLSGRGEGKGRREAQYKSEEWIIFESFNHIQRPSSIEKEETGQDLYYQCPNRKKDIV